MTKKRYDIEYDSNCYMCIVDREEKVLYTDRKKIVKLLNEQHELIQQGFEEIAKANDEKFDYKMKVKETLQKRYNYLKKTQQEDETLPQYWQGAIIEMEVIAYCLGVELK